MPEGYRIVITVVSQKGMCSAGHKKGDSWTLDELTPAGLCMYAFDAIYPKRWLSSSVPGFPGKKTATFLL